MFAKLFKNYIYPIAIMAGSIIGVGFLSLPYITVKVGALPMLFYFIVLTAVIVYVHIIFARISLKTPDFKRFPGFVGFYFGAWPRRVTLLLTVAGAFGILLIYLIVASQFLAAIFGGSEFYYALWFFVVAGAVLYFGIKAIAKIEFLALLLMALLFAIIFIKGLGHIDFTNFFIQSTTYNIQDSFLPYGAILFALWGTGLIPEVEEMVRGHKRSLIKIVVVATLLPALLYALFIFFVVGVTGSSTTESALTGLKAFFQNGVMTVGLAMGVVAIFMAFISQGLILKKTFMYDLGVKEFFSWGMVCAIPLVLFLLGVNSFIPLISFVGGVFLGINGIFILLMYQKIGGKGWVIYPLMLVFLMGIIYELIYFIY